MAVENQESGEKTEEIKDNKTSKKIEKQSITLIVILMLVLASFIVAYLILKPKPYFEYSGMKVYPLRYGDSNIMFFSFPLIFNIQGNNYKEDIIIKSNPFDVENISYSVDESLFKTSKMGFTMDSQLNARAFLAAKEISGLADKIGIQTFFGVVGETENPEVMIFDCENATNLIKVVRMELSNETRIFSKDNCIIVSGDNYDDLMKASDKLVIEWLKVLWGKGIKEIENQTNSILNDTILNQNNSINSS